MTTHVLGSRLFVKVEKGVAFVVIGSLDGIGNAPPVAQNFVFHFAPSRISSSTRHHARLRRRRRRRRRRHYQLHGCSHVMGLAILNQCHHSFQRVLLQRERPSALTKALGTSEAVQRRDRTQKDHHPQPLLPTHHQLFSDGWPSNFSSFAVTLVRHRVLNPRHAHT